MTETVSLNSGRAMPLLGLGCWQSQDEEVTQAVSTAINNGYRLIDTAFVYKNERQVGEGIRLALEQNKLDRQGVFIVTKLPLTGMNANKVEKYLRKSLEELGLKYVDLYLIHCPVGCMERSDELFPLENGKLLIDPSTDHIALWREMERMVQLGLTKDIGLSNFSSKQMMKIIANSKIPPAVHQVELHVLFQQKEMQQFCRDHKIVLMSYGSLGSPGRKERNKEKEIATHYPDLLNNPVVKLIAEKHQHSTAQILLRFLVQQNIIVIPKSVKSNRIKENGDIFSFKLSTLDMEALNYIDQGENGRSFRFSEIFPGYAEHPEAWM